MIIVAFTPSVSRPLNYVEKKEKKIIHKYLYTIKSRKKIIFEVPSKRVF